MSGKPLGMSKSNLNSGSSGRGAQHRDSIANISSNKSHGRIGDSQGFSPSLNAIPPRSMRLNSIAVPRGAGAAAMVGRPIVWTKQAALQKSNVLAYASQPANNVLSVSTAGSIASSAIGRSNASGFATSSNTDSISLNNARGSNFSLNNNNGGGSTGASGGNSAPSANMNSNNTHGASSSSGASALPRQQQGQFVPLGSSIASVGGFSSTMRSQDRQQLAQIQRQSSSPRSILNASSSLQRSTNTSGSRRGMRESISKESSRNQGMSVTPILRDGQPAIGQVSLFSNGTSTGPHSRHGTGSNPFSKSSDAVSALSNHYDDMIKHIGNPLRGPIIVELFAHYMFFLLILFVAWNTAWAPQIRFYLAFVYFFVSCIALEISRIIVVRFPNSSSPFYISFVPLALLIFISREVHQIIVMLWFISVLVIFLQSGHARLFQHLIIFCVVYVATYAVMLTIMYYSYMDNCSGLGCSVALNTPIIAQEEAVLMVDCIFVMFIFSRLERFIKLNASTLLDRENYMQHLYIANMDLKRQLRNAKIENEVDLEAPLTRATQILNEVKETQELEPEIIEELDFIISLLSSDKLFQPDLFQNSNDADVHDWLKDILLTDKGAKGATAAATSGAEAPPGTVPGALGGGAGYIVDQAGTFLSNMDSSAFDMLSAVENPEFDVMDLEVLTGGHALYYISWHIFRQHKLGESLQINEDKFRNLLIKIESGYRRSNPYHNSTHAADVTHSMNYFVTRQRIWSVLKPEEQLSVLIAPIIHDYMHPGVNNAFLIATSNALALRYNDQSVLEHFHSSSFFEMVSQDEYNVIETLSIDQRKTVREFVTSMVLATDMAFHFDWIGKFKGKISGAGINYENKTDKKMVLNVAIKCADVNNPTKPGISSRRWTQLIMEEFFRQGDEEKSLGIPISTFMNRETTDTPKCQIGFIEFIVNPLYEAWGSYMHEDVDVHLRNIQSNKTFWKSCTENPALYTQVPVPSFTVTPAHVLMPTHHSASDPNQGVARTASVSSATSGGNGGAIIDTNIINTAIEENPTSPGNDRTGHSGFPKATPLPDIRSHGSVAPAGSVPVAVQSSSPEPKRDGSGHQASTSTTVAVLSVNPSVPAHSGASTQQSSPTSLPSHVTSSNPALSSSFNSSTSGATASAIHGRQFLPPVRMGSRGLVKEEITTSPLDRPHFPDKRMSTTTSAVDDSTEPGHATGPGAAGSTSPPKTRVAASQEAEPTNVGDPEPEPNSTQKLARS